MRTGGKDSLTDGGADGQKLGWSEVSEVLGRRLSGEASDAEAEEFRLRTLRQLSGCAPKLALAVGAVLGLLYVSKLDLERLQPLTEFISNVLLGVMAVYLSVRANTIARQQKDLSHRQTELLDRQQKLAEDQLRPRLRVRVDPIQDRELGMISRYRIDNEGGDVHEFDVMTMSAVSVTLPGADAEPKSLVLPVNFYQQPRFTHESRGTLFENRALSFAGYSMNSKLEEVRTALRRRFTFCHIDLMHLVYAHSTGAFGGTDTAVFRIPEFMMDHERMTSLRLPYKEGFKVLTTLTTSPCILSLAPVEQAVEIISKLRTGVQGEDLIGYYFMMDKLEKTLAKLEKREMEGWDSAEQR